MHGSHLTYHSLIKYSVERDFELDESWVEYDREEYDRDFDFDDHDETVWLSSRRFDFLGQLFDEWTCPS